MKLLFDENLSPKLVRLLEDLFPEDMHQRSFLLGFPPKIVWVCLGNCSTAEAAMLLRERVAIIEAFALDDYTSFLSLS